MKKLGTLLGFGLIAAICIHIAQGHSLEIVLADLQRGVAVVFLVPAGYLFFVFIRFLFFANRHVYERNRQATLLRNKYNRGILLSEAEQAEIARLVSGGVLEHTGLAYATKGPAKFIRPLQLTKQALDAVWH